MTMLELKMSHHALHSSTWSEWWATLQARVQEMQEGLAAALRGSPELQARRELLALARCHMRHNRSYSADLLAAAAQIGQGKPN